MLKFVRIRKNDRRIVSGAVAVIKEVDGKPADMPPFQYDLQFFDMNGDSFGMAYNFPAECTKPMSLRPPSVFDWHDAYHKYHLRHEPKPYISIRAETILNREVSVGVWLAGSVGGSEYRHRILGSEDIKDLGAHVQYWDDIARTMGVVCLADPFVLAALEGGPEAAMRLQAERFWASQREQPQV